MTTGSRRRTVRGPGLAVRWWLVAPRMVLVSGATVLLLLLLQLDLGQEWTFSLLTSVLFAVLVPAGVVAAFRWWPNAWGNVGWAIGAETCFIDTLRGDSYWSALWVGLVVGGLVGWQFHSAGRRWATPGAEDLAASPARLHFPASDEAGKLDAGRNGLDFDVSRVHTQVWLEVLERKGSWPWGEVASVEAGWITGGLTVRGVTTDVDPVAGLRVIHTGGVQLILPMPDAGTVAEACRQRRAVVLSGALDGGTRFLTGLVGCLPLLAGLAVLCRWNAMTDPARAWAALGLVLALLAVPPFAGWQLHRVRARLAAASTAAPGGPGPDVLAPAGWSSQVSSPDGSITSGESGAALPDPSAEPRHVRPDDPPDRFEKVPALVICVLSFAAFCAFGAFSDVPGERLFCLGGVVFLGGITVAGVAQLIRPTPRPRPAMVALTSVTTYGSLALMGASWLGAGIPLASPDVTAPPAAAPTTIPVGAGPRGIAMAPDGRHAYVSDYGTSDTPGHTVTVIDTGSRRVTATIPVGPHPDDIALSPDGRRGYVVDSGTQEASGGEITVIDILTNTAAATIPLRTRPYAVSASPDGHHVYAALSDTDTTTGAIAVIDPATDTVTATIDLPGTPTKITVAPDARRVYLTDRDPFDPPRRRTSSLLAIDVLTGTVTATIPVGVPARGVTLTPDGRYAYVTAYPDVDSDGSTVTVVDTVTRVVVATIPVGRWPLGLVMAPDGRHAYVAVYGDTDPNLAPVGTTVAVIDTAARRVIGGPRVGANPFGVALTPDGRQAWVPDNGADTVSVIDVG